MSTTTPHFHIKTYDGADQFDTEAFNENFELIDAALHQIATARHYDVTQYGVIADDPAVTTNIAQLNALITTVSADGGGVLYFPTGTYYLTPKPSYGQLDRATSQEYCIWLRSNITLLGDGPTSILKVCDGNGPWDRLFDTAGSQGADPPLHRNITFHNLAIDANPSGNDTYINALGQREITYLSDATDYNTLLSREVSQFVMRSTRCANLVLSQVDMVNTGENGFFVGNYDEPANIIVRDCRFRHALMAGVPRLHDVRADAGRLEDPADLLVYDPESRIAEGKKITIPSPDGLSPAIVEDAVVETIHDTFAQTLSSIIVNLRVHPTDPTRTLISPPLNYPGITSPTVTVDGTTYTLPLAYIPDPGKLFRKSEDGTKFQVTYLDELELADEDPLPSDSALGIADARYLRWRRAPVYGKYDQGARDYVEWCEITPDDVILWEDGEHAGKIKQIILRTPPTFVETSTYGPVDIDLTTNEPKFNVDGTPKRVAGIANVNGLFLRRMTLDTPASATGGSLRVLQSVEGTFATTAGSTLLVPTGSWQEGYQPGEEHSTLVRRDQIRLYQGETVICRTARVVEFTDAGVVLANPIDVTATDVRCEIIDGYDNSVLYGIGTHIQYINNRFVGERGHSAGAMEVHGGKAVVSGNVVENFAAAVNYVPASRVKALGAYGYVAITGNSFYGVNAGVDVYPDDSYDTTVANAPDPIIVQNLVISDNQIAVDHVTYDGMHSNGIGISRSSTLRRQVKHVTITGNVITFRTDSASHAIRGNETTAGIVLSAYGGIEGVIVADNLIQDAPVRGITLTTGAPARNILIRDNLLVNPGRNLNSLAAYRAAIALTRPRKPEFIDDQGTFENIDISRNVIADYIGNCVYSFYAFTYEPWNFKNIRFLDNQIIGDHLTYSYPRGTVIADLVKMDEVFVTEPVDTGTATKDIVFSNVKLTVEPGQTYTRQRVVTEGTFNPWRYVRLTAARDNGSTIKLFDPQNAVAVGDVLETGFIAGTTMDVSGAYPVMLSAQGVLTIACPSFHYGRVGEVVTLAGMADERLNRDVTLTDVSAYVPGGPYVITAQLPDDDPLQQNGVFPVITSTTGTWKLRFGYCAIVEARVTELTTDDAAPGVKGVVFEAAGAQSVIVSRRDLTATTVRPSFWTTLSYPLPDPAGGVYAPIRLSPWNVEKYLAVGDYVYAQDASSAAYPGLSKSRRKVLDITAAYDDDGAIIGYDVTLDGNLASNVVAGTYRMAMAFYEPTLVNTGLVDLVPVHHIDRLPPTTGNYAKGDMVFLVGATTTTPALLTVTEAGTGGPTGDDGQPTVITTGLVASQSPLLEVPTSFPGASLLVQDAWITIDGEPSAKQIRKSALKTTTFLVDRLVRATVGEAISVTVTTTAPHRIEVGEQVRLTKIAEDPALERWWTVTEVTKDDGNGKGSFTFLWEGADDVDDLDLANDGVMGGYIARRLHILNGAISLGANGWRDIRVKLPTFAHYNGTRVVTTVTSGPRTLAALESGARVVVDSADPVTLVLPAVAAAKDKLALMPTFILIRKGAGLVTIKTPAGAGIDGIAPLDDSHSVLMVSLSPRATATLTAISASEWIIESMVGGWSIDPEPVA